MNTALVHCVSYDLAHLVQMANRETVTVSADSFRISGQNDEFWTEVAKFTSYLFTDRSFTSGPQWEVAYFPGTECFVALDREYANQLTELVLL
jgi:hypothetical protein